MTSAYTDTEVMRLANGWLAKYDPAQARDEHGRWTDDGPAPSFRAAAGRTLHHAIASAASAANALDTVQSIYPEGIKDTGVRDQLNAARQIYALTYHLSELKDNLRATHASARDLGAASRAKLQTLRDHIANIGDHITRLKAERTGDTERADELRRRIELRRRAMALRERDMAARMGRVKRPSRSKVMRDRWAGEYARARGGRAEF